MRDFLGNGWSFPIGVDARGRVSLARQERDVEESIRLILLTPQGQRVMRPEFGCRIHELLFAPNDGTTAGLAAIYAREALERWEPRIELVSVDARADDLAPERLLIEISYRVRATHDARSMVFPFYRDPT